MMNSTKNCILFISHDPLTPSIVEMYNLKQLNIVFNVDFISLRSIFHSPDTYSFPDELAGEFIEYCNLYSFRKAISNYNKQNTIVFLELPNNSIYSLFVLRILKGYKLAKMLIYKSFGIEFNYKPKSIKRVIFKIINPSVVYKKILRSLIVIKYDIVFSPGESTLISTLYKKLVPINSSVFYEQKIDKLDFQQKYCVYVDQAFPSHPDLLRMGYKCHDIEGFINSFNSFFSYIENKFSLEVVIAKHPKSLIDDAMYCGRKVYTYKTVELINNASLVLGHISLVQNNAILRYTPIILFYNSEMKNFPNNFFLTLNKLQSLINCPLVNIDQLPDKIDISVNKSLYDIYIKQFIIGDKYRSNHQIVIETLQEEFLKS